MRPCVSWMRCRNSISRSRRRGRTPSNARISSRACGSTARPFMAGRTLRSCPRASAIGMTRGAAWVSVMKGTRGASAAEQRADGHAGVAGEIGGGHLLAALRLQLEDLDLAPVRADADAVGADCQDFADLTFDGAKGARRMLARIE